MTVIASIRPRRGRNVELALLLFAVAIVMFAYISVGLATKAEIPARALTIGGLFVAITVVFHLVLRWRAPWADPLILPIVTVLNGMGLVMIDRIDIAESRTAATGWAFRQLLWTGLGVALAVLVILALRDHRLLRRYTYLSGLIGLILLLSPLLPFIGTAVYSARLWITIGSFTVQPGELAKILLTIFFAGYLVQTRDALSVAGRRFLGMQLPRARDLAPILLAWLTSVGVLVFERDLGSSLLFFGLFVAMLYVATERRSWVAIGLGLFLVGAFTAYLLFSHVQVRVTGWLDPFSPAALQVSDQLALGLMGMASGGMMGTGLGLGRPDITYFAHSDFIVPSLGEEIGLIGLFALLILYVLLIERGMRTAIGTRDGFGKLLASGLAFSIALQCFVVVGGVTRVIPLTGLTMPFMSAGGSSLLANWVIVGILLRISDGARRPLIDKVDTSPGSPTPPGSLTPPAAAAAESGRADTEVVQAR